MKVTTRDEAIADLIEIYVSVARENPIAANDLVRRVRERIRRLATPGFSHMGRAGAVPSTRELVEVPYIIVYQVDESRNEIAVIAVFHTKRDRK